jgi:hypothetical protein
MTEPLYETPALNSVREDIFFLQVSTSFLSEELSAVNMLSHNQRTARGVETLFFEMYLGTDKVIDALER